MKIGNNGLLIIKHYEGLRLKIYRCPGGYLTIGYGHVLKWYEHELFKQGISKEMATDLLVADVASAERSVNLLIQARLTQNQFDALVSFTFNLGSGALQSSTLRMVINRCEYHEAPRQLRRWVFAGGRKLRGLVRRRRDSAILFMS